MKNIVHPTVKKTWITPQVIIIATCDIEGGVSPGFHEDQITNSILTGNGHYLFLKTSGGNALANKAKNAYYS